MSFLSVVGTGLKIFGQIQSGRQEAAIHQYNAAVNLQRASLEAEKGRITQERLRKQQKSFRSKQVAAFAKAGVTLAGSPFQTIADSAAELEFDMMIEDFNTRVAVMSAQSGAQLDFMRSSQATTSSLLSAGTTLLTQLPSFVGSRNSSIPTTPSYRIDNFDRVTTTV